MKTTMKLLGKYRVRQTKKTCAIILFGLFFFIGANCFGQELQISSVVRNTGNHWNDVSGGWPVGGVGQQWTDVLKKYNPVRLGSPDPFVKSDGLENSIAQFVYREVRNGRGGVDPSTVYLTMGSRKFICFIYAEIPTSTAEEYSAWVYEIKSGATINQGAEERPAPASTPTVTNGDAKAHFNAGRTSSSRNDYDMAIAEYTEAIRLDPNYTSAYINRGVAYHKKEDYDRAIADYTQAIRLDPNEATAYYNRAVTYRKKNDNDRAIADYTQTIRLDPNYVDAYFGRGVAYHMKKDYDRAIADYNQAIRLDPNYAAAKKNLEISRKARGY